MTAPIALGFTLLLGIAGGIAVGSGVIALFIVLDMVPRLAQLTSAFIPVHFIVGGG